jgi:hypothetical protein
MGLNLVHKTMFWKRTFNNSLVLLCCKFEEWVLEWFNNESWSVSRKKVQRYFLTWVFLLTICFGIHQTNDKSTIWILEFILRLKV